MKNNKERNLKELTLDYMLQGGGVQFYQREIDETKIADDTPAEDLSIEELSLNEEQEVSNEIETLLSFIVGDIKLEAIQFDNYEGISIYPIEGDRFFITNDKIVEGIKAYFKDIGYRKTDYIINQTKVAKYWEIKIGHSEEYRDISTTCKEFLMLAIIELI